MSTALHHGFHFNDETHFYECAAQEDHFYDYIICYKLKSQSLFKNHIILQTESFVCFSTESDKYYAFFLIKTQNSIPNINKVATRKPTIKILCTVAK